MISEWLPPAILPLARAFSPTANRYQGPLANWDDAVRHSKGYDDNTTISRLTEAARASRDGALVDQDGILIEPSPHFPLLAAVYKTRTVTSRAPVVLDFGGALGSSFRANRVVLPDDIDWRIVEQPALVDIGSREFLSRNLSFFRSIPEACETSPPDIALLASVLQYLQDPWAALAEVAASGVKSVLLDRTPFIDDQIDLPCVQNVPSRIYPGSYPLWLLSRRRLDKVLQGWSLVLERPSREGRALTTRFRSFGFYDIVLERQ